MNSDCQKCWQSSSVDENGKPAEVPSLVAETDEEKEFLAQLQEPKEDPQAGLIQAATAQAAGEAERAQAEARNLDAKSLDNVASATKKEAETRQIISETENSKVKTLLDIQKENREELQSFPI